MQASELERLVVRLVGEGNDYERVLDDATAQTEKAAKEIGALTEDAMAAQNAAMEEAARITNALRTPTEKYADELGNLERLYKAGHLSQETYNRAVKKATGELPSVAKAQAKYNEELREAAEVTKRAMSPAQKYSKEVKNLKAMHAAGRITTQTYKRSIRELNREFGQGAHKVAAYGSKISGVGRSMAAAGAAATLGLTVPILGLAGASVAAGSAIDSAFSGLKKTVDAPASTLQNIRQEMEDMVMGGTPFDLTELLGIGETAGQLGIDTSNIVSFTKTIADLKVTTNLGDEAATTLARIANITGLPQTEFEKLGSAIVALGNTTATTEAEIAAMMMRLSGAGRQIGLSVPDIAAISASLSSVGVEAEAGGTAFSQLFMRLSSAVAGGGEDLEKFAKVAGLSGEKFATLFGEDAAGALKQLLTGLNRLEGKDAILALEEMGIEGARLRDVMLRSAGAVDIMSEALKTAEDEFGAGTALAKEAAIRYASFASQVKNLWAQVKLLGADIFDVIAGPLLSGIAILKTWIAWFKNLSHGTKQVIVVFAAMLAAVGPLLGMIGAAVAAVGGLVSAVAMFAAVGWEMVLIGAAVAAYLAIWVTAAAAVGAALAALVYYIVGPESIVSGFTYAMETAKTWAMNTIGFIANIGTNLKVLMDWFPRNWDKVMQDVMRGFFIATVNLINNAVVTINIFRRIFTAWAGWMVGKFQNVFTIDFLYWISQGIVKAGQAFIDFAGWAWHKLEGIFTGQGGPTLADLTGQLGADFESGRQGGNLLQSVTNIVQEESGKFKGPMEGFESSIEEMPEFAFGMGQKTGKALSEGIEAGANAAGGAAGGGVAAVSEGLTKSIDALNAKLQTQINQYGLAGTALEVWKLKQAGATEAQLTATRAAESHLRALEAGGLIEKMIEQAKTFGLTGRALELYKIESLGATDAQLKAARALDKKLTRMEAEKKLSEEAKKLTEKHRTPLAKYNEEREKLNKMLKKGLIDLTTFNSAMEDAEKQYKKEIRVKIRVDGVDAALAGTTEAQARLEAFRALKPVAKVKGVAGAAGAGVPAGVAGRAGVPVGRGEKPLAPPSDEKERATILSVLQLIEENTRPGDNVVTLSSADV